MEGLHKVRQEIARLRATHTDLLQALMQSEPFIQGSAVRRFSVCGKPGCRCQRGEKHGPFWYLSRSENGHNRLWYLEKEKAEVTVARVQVYRRWRQLRQRLRQVERAIQAALDQLGKVLGETGEGGAVVCRTGSGERIVSRHGAHS